MDQERFDRLTKSLATGRSRRSLLRGGLAAVAAIVLGGKDALGHHSPGHGGGGGNQGGGGPAEPGKKPGRCGLPGQPCKFGMHCCSGTCLNGYCTETEPSPCEPGEECSGGLCCPSGYVACPGSPAGCIDASTACSGLPVCCETENVGGILCGTEEGTCPEGSAPPPTTCPSV